MAKPRVGDSIAFTGPPIELIAKDKSLYDFLLMIYDHVYGLNLTQGSLNNDNVQGKLTDTIDHTQFVSVTAYQHHGAGQHANLDQAAAQVDLGGTVPASAVSVASPAATDLPTVITLANENKTDTNQLVVDLNLAITKLNAVTVDIDALKAKLRTSKVLAT